MVTVTKNERRDFDTLVEEHLANSPNAPLTMRLVPSLYVPHGDKRYVAVQGGTWTIEIEHPAREARLVWNALDRFLTDELAELTTPAGDV